MVVKKSEEDNGELIKQLIEANNKLVDVNASLREDIQGITDAVKELTTTIAKLVTEQELLRKSGRFVLFIVLGLACFSGNCIFA